MPQLDKISFFYSIVYVYTIFTVLNVFLLEFYVRPVLVNFWAFRTTVFKTSAQIFGF